MSKPDEKPKQPELVKPIEPVNPVVPNNIPDVEALVPEVVTTYGASQPDLSEYSGRYINQLDKLPYALVVREGDEGEKTHHLRNSRNYDNCTKQEFKERYERAEKE